MLLGLFLLGGCSKPVANFLISADSRKAPALINFKNSSTGADSFVWTVNDSIVSEQETVDHLFLSSGRHEISLIASKLDKSDKKMQTIFIDAPELCHVYMNTTAGPFIFKLSESTPTHRDNFIKLIESGYYHGLSFHRVIEGFMIQGGDDKSRKKKGNFTFQDQIKEEINTELLHFKGALAAARMPDDVNPDKYSSGTQFYIVDGRDLSTEDIENYESNKLFSYSQENIQQYLKSGGAPQLDGEYTIFGYLISGFETLDKIAKVETGNADVPVKDIRILETKIVN